MGRPVGSMNKPKEEVVVETKEEADQERKFSDERDHKGAGYPLCLNCDHREDMHHTWNKYRVIENHKDFLGNVKSVEKFEQEKTYGEDRPCQHACKCKQYK